MTRRVMVKIVCNPQFGCDLLQTPKIKPSNSSFTNTQNNNHCGTTLDIFLKRIIIILISYTGYTNKNCQILRKNSQNITLNVNQ